MRIQEILAAPIAGNAGSDMPLIDKIHTFVTEDNPIDLKIKALQKLDEVMGLDTADQVTEESVQLYLEADVEMNTPATRDPDTKEVLKIWTQNFLRYLYQIDETIEPGIAGMGSSDGHQISMLTKAMIRKRFEGLDGYSVDDNPDDCDGTTGKPFKEFCITKDDEPDQGFTVYWDDDTPDQASLNWFE